MKKLNKHICIVFYLLLNLSGINSQSQVLDSLQQILKTAKHDSTRIRLRIKIGEVSSTMRTGFWDSLYADSKMAGIKKLEALTSNNAGFIHNIHGNTKKALEYQQISLKIKEGLGDKSEIASSLTNIGAIFCRQGDNLKAKEHFNRSLTLYREVGDKVGEALSLNNVGYIYYNQGDIKKALEYYEGSLKIKEKIGIKNGIAYTLNNLAGIYTDQGDHQKAMEYYQRSLSLRESIKDKIGIVESLNNIGSLCVVLKNHALAMEYYEKSLLIGKEINDKIGMAGALHNMALIYEASGDFNKAIEFYNNALELREQNGDKMGLANLLKDIAELRIKTGEINKALLSANRSMIIANELGYPTQQKSTASVLKKIFIIQNKHKEALAMFEFEIKMRDSINNEGTRKASIKSQLKYEYEKQATADSVAHAKESEIKSAELSRQSAEIKAKKNQQYALFGGLALVLIFAGFMFNRFKVTQRQKFVIEKQKLMVEHQKHLVEEKQKEILDSIRYAKRIQTAHLPSHKKIENALLKLQKNNLNC